MIAHTNCSSQTRCFEGETAGRVDRGKSWSRISQKRSGEFCPLDEAPIPCPRRGGLTLRKKTPSCCNGPETVERYPYGAGRISSREGCECIDRLPNVLRRRPKLIVVFNRSVVCSEFCCVQKENGERILL